MTAYPLVPLEDFCEIVSGATPKTGVGDFWDGDILWVTPKDLSDLQGKFIDDTPRKITEVGLRSCAATILPKGSVLFSSRAPIGHVAINTVPMATNQGFKSLIPDRERADANYLYYWLRSHRSYLESLGNGATFKEVSKAVVSKIAVPLPPLEAQRHIARVLDRVGALRAKRREAIALLDDLAQSVFLNMFGDVARNDRGWDDSRTLGEVAHVGSGITKGRKETADPVRAVPYMAVLNVQERRLDLSVVKEIEATEAEIERYRLVEDDLLLTEGGDPDKLGRGTLWRNELPECIHQNHIFRVRLGEGSGIEPIFLNWLVASERGRRYFLRSAKQTTGIASINATQLKQFPLLVPPTELQQSFARRLSELERHQASHVAHLAELDALFASLQYRAFRGELWADVPTV